MIPRRSAIHRWAWRWWEGRAGLPGRLADLVAWPGELIYRLLLAVREMAYRLGFRTAREASIPILSVGNLTVGGTGKTPFAAWIARRLLDEGVRPAVVLRGYGEDEVDLHRRWNPDVPVHVHPRRLEGVEAAAEGGAQVAILDDGFQHRELAREADVVLMAAEDPLPARLLPRGPYREPLTALGRAHLVVVTRKTALDAQARALEDRIRRVAPGTRIGRIRLRPAGWADLTGAPAGAPPGAVLAVAGVARPRSFVGLLEEERGERPEILSYPDHHEYTTEDADEIRRRAGGRTVVVTEKDAVKLAPLADRLPETRVLTLEVEPEGRGRVLDVLVTSLVTHATLDIPGSGGASDRGA